MDTFKQHKQHHNYLKEKDEDIIKQDLLDIDLESEEEGKNNSSDLVKTETTNSKPTQAIKIVDLHTKKQLGETKNKNQAEQR